MTYGILNSINKKDRLYKLLLKTDVISDKYAVLRATFKQNSEFSILFDIIHVQLIEPNSVGSLLL